MRDSSPPDAILASDCGFWPGFALIKNSISSSPHGRASSSLSLCSVASKTPPGIPRPDIASVTAFENFAAALLRARDSACAFERKSARMLFTCASSSRLRSAEFFSSSNSSRNLSCNAGTSSTVTRCLRAIACMASRRSSTQSRRLGSMSMSSP